MAALLEKAPLSNAVSATRTRSDSRLQRHSAENRLAVKSIEFANHAALQSLENSLKRASPNHPVLRSEPLGARFKTIRVADSNGDEITIYEILEVSFFGWVAEQRFQLCTGEEVEPFDQDNFLVLGTGERLVRIS